MDEEFLKFCIDELREHMFNTALTEEQEIALGYAMDLLWDVYVAELRKTQEIIDGLKATGMMN